MPRRYRNPPIIEAFCEFQFERDTPWDLTMPGLVYERLKDTFPERRPGKVVDVGILVGSEGVQQRVQTTDRMQFVHSEGKALVQVGPRLLAVNHLKPYPSWKRFFPLIKEGFEAYCKEVAPKDIHRVGLRYINRIEIPTQRIELEDYFEFYPFVGPSLPQDLDSFIIGIQAPYEGSRDILKLQLTRARPETPDIVAMILDLDYYLARPGQIALENIFEWVELAHNHIEEAFEACITDHLRQMFEEVAE